jgi:hypothetical protein
MSLGFPRAMKWPSPAVSNAVETNGEGFRNKTRPFREAALFTAFNKRRMPREESKSVP